MSETILTCENFHFCKCNGCLEIQLICIMEHCALSLQEEIAKDLLSGDYEEETQSSADDLTPSVTSHEATDFFPRTLRCKC